VVKTLAVDTGASLVLTLALGALLPAAPMDTLVAFYAKVRPFGFWGPVRQEAVRRGLVPARDRMPQIDMLNGCLTAVFQVSLALIPFYLFLRELQWMALWLLVAAGLGVVLYFTWYKNLPAADEA
jgi:hypothetical protein